MKIIIMSFCLLVPLKTLAAADVLNGLWDISLTLQAEGQRLGPYSKQICLTKEDVQNPSRLFGESGGHCEYSNKRYFANQFNFNVTCSASGIPFKGSGQIEFSAENLTGNMSLMVKLSDGPSLETVSAVYAKRLGDCNK